MIIKSTTRKSNSFSQLFSYLHREAEFEARSFNMYGNNRKTCLKEFLENAKYIKNSRGKVYLYHEIISLDKELENANEILFDLAKKYTQLRAKNHLVYTVVHNNTKNPHIHLIISANEITNTKRKRLAKSSFKQIQSELENYKNQRYKELSNSNHYESAKDSSKQKRAEQEMNHKRSAKTTKEQIIFDLEKIFSNTTSKTFLDNALKNKGFEIYQRGATTGIIFENKKYRLKTLGLEASYNQTLSKIQKIEQRKDKRSDAKQERSPLRKQTKEQNQTRDNSR